MRLRTILFALILMMTMCASCASTDGPASEAGGGKETAAEQEAPEKEQEEASLAGGAASNQKASAENGSTSDLAAAAQPDTFAENGASAGQTTTTQREAAAEQEGLAEQAACAEEIKSLFEEGGPLSGILPEGTDIDGIVEQMDLADKQISAVVEEVLRKAGNMPEGISGESLGEFAEALAGRFLGSGEAGDSADILDFDSMDELFRIYSTIENAEVEYIKEHNAALMDCGDVQIVTVGNLASQDTIDQEESRFLRCMIQNNYTVDEENHLRFVSTSEDVVLFTHENDVEGAYPVREAEFAEKGDNYLESVKEMYGRMDEPADEFEMNLEFNRLFVPYDLKAYMEEHPEVKGIEYDGEIRTAKELDELWNAMIDEMYVNSPEDISAGDTSADPDTASPAESSAE